MRGLLDAARSEQTEGVGPGRDVRLVVPAAAAWVGAIAGTMLALRWVVAVAVLAVLVAGAFAWWSSTARLAALAAVVCLLATAGAGAARVAVLDRGPLHDLAAREAYVSVTATVTDDPLQRTSPSRFGSERSYVIARLRVTEVSGRGHRYHVRSPVLLVAGEDWLKTTPGQRVRAAGRLAPGEAAEGLGAVLRTSVPPTVIGEPPGWLRWTEPLREGLRQSVSALPEGPRGLVPALVVGDESLLPPDLTEDMRTAGLLHLNAVSGANVAIVLAAVMGSARAVGVRGYALPVAGAAAVVGFVLLARPQPSVLRAAAMGLVALAGLSAGGRRRGLATLSVAVLVLVLVDPFLGRSAGFALSVLATGGILVLGPVWTEAGSTWLPRPLAVACAVPLAAQVACTPIVVGLSSQLSLVSLPANLLAAPAVAPATLAGAAASVVAPWWTWGGQVLGHVAGGCAWWIVEVAEASAGLPGAARSVGGVGPLAVLALIVASGLAVLLLPRILRRRWLAIGLAVVLTIAILHPHGLRGVLGRGSWPPTGWVLVACDIGQGDALVIRAGPSSAMVIDAGPDPLLVDRCLDRLDVRQVPVLVLSHFHSDHVEGLPGVLDGRQVGRIVVSPLDDPAEESVRVRGWAEQAQVPVVDAVAGQTEQTGGVSWRVIWPALPLPAGGSAPNNASVVLRVEVARVSVLLTGDIEREAQAAILRGGEEIAADVLKVPHHGSGNQDAEFLEAVDPVLALVCVGADNTYGHPTAPTLRQLVDDGAVVQRTDSRGSVAVVVGDGRLRVSDSGAGG